MLHTDEQKIDELLSRGVEEVIDKDNLKKRLMSGKKLRIKLGIDPTSPNIHIGRAVLLWKLKAFQDLGHTAVFIIGDTTGVVGDTSDKEAERPMLSKEEVKSNMKTYFDQVFKILNRKKTETHYNSEWLSKLGLHELARIASLFGLHEFSSRDVIARRLRAGQRVSFQELMYPIMQGYDSVKVEADVELGGRDQRFNLLTGRRIQPIYNQKPQDIIMMEILEGTDGRKMSSSWGNGVNIMDTPNDMYGKIMSLKDDLIMKYFKLATNAPLEAIRAYEKQLGSGENQKKVKMALASEIVRMYHGDKAALAAEDTWQKTFSAREMPVDAKVIKVKLKIPLVEILMKEGIVASKSEFRRLIKEGAIRFKGTLEEKRIVDPNTLASESGDLKIGKRRFLKIEIMKK